MDEEDWKIIHDALLSDPQSPHNPLLAPEAFESDDAFQFPSLPSDCVNDETVPSNNQVTWDLGQVELAASPQYNQSIWDHLQCDDEFESPLQPGHYLEDEIVTSHSPPTLDSQTPWDLLEVNPSNTREEICPGPMPMHIEQFPTQAGPSYTQAGSSYTENVNELQPLTFQCQHCKKFFTTKFSLNRHIHTTHEEENTTFDCKHCGRPFKRKDYLQGHIKAKHSNNEPGYPCAKCGKKFTKAYTLKQHSQTPCTTKKPLSGNTGGESSLAVDVDTLNLECQHCKKVFISKYTLSRHIRTLHEEEPTAIECNHCGMRFLRRDCLKEHIKVRHANSVPGGSGGTSEIQCSKCGKTLSGANHWLRHSRLSCPSLREQPLLNTDGESAAVDVDVDTRVVESQAPTTAAEPGHSTVTSEQLSFRDDGHAFYVCPKCGLKYIMKSSLKRHLRQACGVPPQFSCSLCPYATYYKNCLKLHMVRKHGTTLNQ